jgi:hypothetical protein
MLHGLQFIQRCAAEFMVTVAEPMVSRAYASSHGFQGRVTSPVQWQSSRLAHALATTAFSIATEFTVVKVRAHERHGIGSHA